MNVPPATHIARRDPLTVPECSPKQNFATQTAQTTKPEFCHLQDQVQTPDRAGQGTGRGVNWFTLHKSIISFLGSCARGFETKTWHNAFIANCREKFMIELFMSSL